MKFTKRARTIAEIIDLSLGGQSGGHLLSCLDAPLTQTFFRFFGFSEIIPIFASEINNNTIMKLSTKYYIGSFQLMATKPINGINFTSWRTPDNKHFYLAPYGVDLNVLLFGRNPDFYEISYLLLGLLDMVK